MNVGPDTDHNGRPRFEVTDFGGEVFEVTPQTFRQALDRTRRPDYRRWAEQVDTTGGCSRPVRLVGHTTKVDESTGEVTSEYHSAAEPDGVTYVRCGNRRATVCPSCSAEYKGDLWHLLVAGTTGGKGVPDTIRAHPLVFATLTAPSFGAVHRAAKPGRPSRICRQRHTKRTCDHGRPQWCSRRHDSDVDLVGQPLCPDCYDYRGQLIWQWWAPELWRRFTIRLRRLLAIHVGVSEKRCRDLVRVQFAKVAEFQQRGAVHFHGLVRLDGPPVPGDEWPAPLVNVTAQLLATLIAQAATEVEYSTPDDGSELPQLSLRFGTQVDTRMVHELAPETDAGTGDLRAETVAAYIAKYATKSADDLNAGGERANPHLSRLRETIDTLAAAATPEPPDCDDPATVAPYARLGKWVHMLGFRGHFGTKSRHFSTTLRELREARRDWKANPASGKPDLVQDLHASDADAPVADAVLVIGSWRFAGMGWLTNGDAALAADAAARARERRVTRAANAA
jgi:hypothetical protein